MVPFLGEIGRLEVSMHGIVHLHRMKPEENLDQNLKHQNIPLSG
eukprot:gene26554-biopygen16843